MPETRKVPAPSGNRHLRETRANGYQQSNPDQWHEAPCFEDRAVEHAIEVLHEYGYGIAMRCLDCHRPITSAASLARMRGRVCQARAEAVAG